MAKVGSFLLVLHSHFPYVLSHGRWPHGTDWLCEGVTETYIPLLNSLTRLEEEGYKPRVTLSFSPIVLEQLAHPDFHEELRVYLAHKKELAITDIDYFAKLGEEGLSEMAAWWRDWYEARIQDFEVKYNGDLVGAFRKLQDDGVLEIGCAGATHGYLPLLSLDTSVQAQVKVAKASYERHFGRAPRAFWMPECAYRPRYEWTPPLPIEGWDAPRLRKGVDEFLSEEGLWATFVETSLLTGGKTLGNYAERFQGLKDLWQQFEQQYAPRKLEEERSCYSAYLTSSDPLGHAPVAIFARDPEAGMQVWSGDWGYPGDPEYLDFHKKHWPGGLRYWKVTHSKADLGAKGNYSLQAAASRLPEHADHFHSLVKQSLALHAQELGDKALVCAMFDTELFGHWWFEGCDWLYEMLKRMAQDEEIELASASDYVQAHPPTVSVALPEGSWGEGGFHWVWLNEETEWTWRLIYEAEARFAKALDRDLNALDELSDRLLKQAARELLLLQSSDWQFLITTRNTADYGAARLKLHYEAVSKLLASFEKHLEGQPYMAEDLAFLADVEAQDDVFADLDLAWFAKLDHPAC